MNVGILTVRRNDGCFGDRVDNRLAVPVEAQRLAVVGLLSPSLKHDDADFRLRSDPKVSDITLSNEGVRPREYREALGWITSIIAEDSNGTRCLERTEVRCLRSSRGQ
ncbi:hypothetical protein KC329_g64 [Hortaea werneckii]|nr:hypothetical protein KC329_g64 [Hortaea werneckii]